MARRTKHNPPATGSGARHRYHFETLTALVDYVEKAPIYPCYKEGAGKASYGDGNWHGTKDLPEALSLARNGWPVGRNKLVAAFTAAQAQFIMEAAFNMDVAGAYPIVALAVAGDPCNMVDLAPIEKRNKPIVRLVANMVASATYKAEEMINYGAAVLSYLDGLESAGFRCELTWQYFVGLNVGSGCYNLTVIAKQAEEPMELDKLAFMWINPSMSRRLGFQHCQSKQPVDPLPDGSMHGCGSIRNHVAGVDTEAGQLLIPGINVFSPGSPQLRSPEAAALALAPILKRMLSEAGIAPPELAYGGKAEAA